MATSTYAYKVRDGAGKVRSGTLDAETAVQVATKLRTMGYAPISIAEQKASGLQREITIRDCFRNTSGIASAARAPISYRNQYRAEAARNYQLAGDRPAALRLWTELAKVEGQGLADEARVRIGELEVKPAR